ncbi:SgrR family transcriptional regulator [Vibrio sp.]|nr:SgrR family transcriptional regulator [Vibrio sp.]
MTKANVTVRLIEQFELLSHQFNNQDVELKLEQITLIFECTPRNARMVLGRMDEIGWIVWHPVTGRGKLSKLFFRATSFNIRFDYAVERLHQGEWHKAVELFPDKKEWFKVLESFFNYSYQENQWSFQWLLPFDTSRLPVQNDRITSTNLFSLHPEIAKLCQVSLIRVEDGIILPSLAFRWMKIKKGQWHFYLSSLMPDMSKDPEDTNFRDGYEGVKQSVLTQVMLLLEEGAKVSWYADSILVIESSLSDVDMITRLSCPMNVSESTTLSNYSLKSIDSHEILLESNKKEWLPTLRFSLIQPESYPLVCHYIERLQSRICLSQSPVLSNKLVSGNNYSDECSSDEYRLYIHHKQAVLHEELTTTFEWDYLDILRVLPKKLIADYQLTMQHQQPHLVFSLPKTTEVITIGYHPSLSVFYEIAMSLANLLAEKHVQTRLKPCFIDQPCNTDIYISSNKRKLMENHFSFLFWTSIATSTSEQRIHTSKKWIAEDDFPNNVCRPNSQLQQKQS